MFAIMLKLWNYLSVFKEILLGNKKVKNKIETLTIF